MADGEVQAGPWEVAQPHEQLFVLVTGANGGIGLAIGQRLIDEFLATRSLTSHLVLVPTTRSVSKCRDTIDSLRAYAEQTAQASTALRSRYGQEEEEEKTRAAGGEGQTDGGVHAAGYRWQDAAARIHIVSITLDLNDLRSLAATATQLRESVVGNPPGVEGPDGRIKAVRIPRFDSIIFNAGYGGWVGLDFVQAIWKFLIQGPIVAATWPTFKLPLPTGVLNKQPQLNYPPKPLLGEVFCACVFGHYILAHKLLPLLSRPQDSPVSPGRIIWSSSVEAIADTFSLDDIQALRTPLAYESVKRLTDVLALTHTLPSVRASSSYFIFDGDGKKRKTRQSRALDVMPPRMYVTHPGVVASTLFPCPWWLYWAYELTIAFCRWLGSPWHTCDAYSGAKSPVWLALQDQDALDATGAERIKWGSSSNRQREVMVKPTEVDDWGWRGRVEDAANDDEGVTGVLRKAIGRRPGVEDVSEESLQEFELLGRDCWEQMEELRAEWEAILDL